MTFAQTAQSHYSPRDHTIQSQLKIRIKIKFLGIVMVVVMVMMLMKMLMLILMLMMMITLLFNPIRSKISHSPMIMEVIKSGENQLTNHPFCKDYSKDSKLIK